MALDRGQYDAAETLLSESLARAEQPHERAYFLNKRGIARVRQGRRSEARADFEEALRAFERYAPALANLGNLMFEEDRVEEAIAAYRQAIDADAEHTVAYANLGAALKRAGRYDEAVRIVKEGRRIAGRKKGA